MDFGSFVAGVSLATVPTAFVLGVWKGQQMVRQTILAIPEAFKGIIENIKNAIKGVEKNGQKTTSPDGVGGSCGDGVGDLGNRESAAASFGRLNIPLPPFPLGKGESATYNFDTGEWIYGGPKPKRNYARNGAKGRAKIGRNSAQKSRRKKGR